MSYLEYSVRRVPSGPAKILHLNWALIVLILAVCGFGVVMLWSVAGGRFDVWADAQLTRIGAGFVVMIAFAMVPIWFWRNVAGLAYGVALVAIGILMVGPVTQLDFRDYTELIPAFLTIVLISFTFNIGVGLTAGLLLYPVLKLLTGRAREVSLPLWLLAALSLLFYLVYPYR